MKFGRDLDIFELAMEGIFGISKNGVLKFTKDSSGQVVHKSSCSMLICKLGYGAIVSEQTGDL